MLLHLVCAPLQIFVVDHFDGPIADYIRYDHQGAVLVEHVEERELRHWRDSHGVHGIVGNGSVSHRWAGIVMFIPGAGLNQVAAFFVPSSWLALLSERRSSISPSG